MLESEQLSYLLPRFVFIDRPRLGRAVKRSASHMCFIRLFPLTNCVHGWPENGH